MGSARSEIAVVVRERIRALRTAQGMSQERLAEVAGMSPDGLNRIERGTRVPTLDTIVAISSALGIHPTDLLGAEDPEVPGLSPRALGIAHALTDRPEFVQKAAEDAVRALLRAVDKTAESKG